MNDMGVIRASFICRQYKKLESVVTNKKEKQENTNKKVFEQNCFPNFKANDSSVLDGSEYRERAAEHEQWFKND